MYFLESLFFLAIPHLLLWDDYFLLALLGALQPFAMMVSDSPPLFPDTTWNKHLRYRPR